VKGDIAKMQQKKMANLFWWLFGGHGCFLARQCDWQITDGKVSQQVE
jgi:hypothetical protein